MSEIKLAIVGAGYMAQTTHIPCFQATKGAQIVGLASDRAQLRKAVAERFHIPQEYSSWQDVAADPNIEGAVVLLPPEYNPDIVCALLEAGKHVFCEKPMALSLAQAQRMADTAQRNHRILMLGFMKRYDSGVERAKALWDKHFASGDMGELITGHVWCLLGGNWTANIERLVSVLRTDEPQGAKPIADKGPAWLPPALAKDMPSFASPYYFFNHVHSHNVNLLRYFLGDNYEVVYADFRHKTKIVHLAYGQALVTIETGAGISAYAFEEGMRMYFQKGWIEIIPPPPLQMQSCAAVTMYRGEDVMSFKQPLGEYDWSFRRQAQHFVDCIREQRQPRTNGQDSVGDMALIEAIFRKAIELGNI